ncbi:hypothetical protein K2173_017953 [Erythroxylum novogranatense]|uniref:RRM domain-containing protein n=1 Tax=Erythroxylum novogranatense TaxID=1862640 RepID=A0AAV8TUA9_9ROSI|nr:hypothetical protein K2173_017953 [Erythroxylum novogranatense]
MEFFLLGFICRMEMEPGKLFIGGISWDTNEDRLKEYFQAFGEVNEAVIMKDRTTGRARGFGFVVFADPGVAERVVMEKHLIDGRNVEAKKAVPRDDQNLLNKNINSIYGSPGHARTKKIFVGGLAPTVTESDFKKYFDQFGIITDVVVMYDHYTQRPRGFGFITYDSEEAVDRVLLKNFHELNGKMVEVKLAVPKELSPGPTRGQFGVFNYSSPSRVTSLLNGSTQGYNSNAGGGYGTRMDGRFSPVTVGRSGFSPYGAGYGIGVNLEQGLGTSYGENSNLSLNLGYGKLSPLLNGNTSRYDSPFVYGVGNGGNNSVLSSTARSLWANGSINQSSHSISSNAAMGSGGGSSGMSSFGSIGALWGSTAHPGQIGGAGASYGSGNLGNGNANSNVGLGVVGYGRNNGSSVASLAFRGTPNGGYDRVYTEINDDGLFYGDLTWPSSPSEIERSASFGFGLGNADVMTRNTAGYIGGYSVANRQSNSGIAA